MCHKVALSESPAVLPLRYASTKKALTVFLYAIARRNTADGRFKILRLCLAFSTETRYNGNIIYEVKHVTEKNRNDDQ